jgi:ubiquinone/menaquinone biosynthesis C-methylase UbiE
MQLIKNINESTRKAWLKLVLSELPAGSSILDAGAGQLGNKQYCGHLQYVAQDFSQYVNPAHQSGIDGLHPGKWDTSRVDIVSDITCIPCPSESFDALLCSEVLEHVPDPMAAIDEFYRILKPNGVLIITAPYSSNVHMAPFHFYSGFTRYWYEHHLVRRGLQIKSLTANGDWFAMMWQEISHLPSAAKDLNKWTWPLAYLFCAFAFLYFRLGGRKSHSPLTCFGWHCVAIKAT